MNQYEYGGSWGDQIVFFPKWNVGSENQKVCGWKEQIPSIGDELLVPAQSGKTMVFEFLSIDRPGDPNDMFFADVEFVRYL